MSDYLWIEALKKEAHYAPDEQVLAAVHWNFTQVPAEIQACLRWRPTLKVVGVYLQAEPGARIVQQFGFVPPGAAGTQNVAFQLPAGPYSFDGKKIKITWELRVTATDSLLHFNSEIFVVP